MYPRVVAVRHVSDYKLKITFSDGVISVIDWQQRLKKARPGGVFEPLRMSVNRSDVKLSRCKFYLCAAVSVQKSHPEPKGYVASVVP